MRPQRLDELSANLESFGLVLWPEEAVEPILSGPTRAAVLEWLEELYCEDELAEVGIPPRRKAVFSGAPGGGKTTLAHHIAARLGMPVCVVQSDQIIDAYVGSTGRNIGALFKAAEATENAVLFFDEFDALAAKRMSARQGAESERNNSVNVLLQRLERYQGIVIAATNRSNDIDPAVWRRFELHLTLDMPDQSARERILERYLEPYSLAGRSLTALARDLSGASPALIRQFCEGLKRALVLGPKVGWSMDKAACVERVIASVQPHADLQRPPLWSMGGKAPSVMALNWPLERIELEAA